MTIISNIGADLKNYRLQIINLWEDGEDCPLLDNPQDGDMVSYRSVGADGVPVVEDVKVYQNGEWVEQGGGSGNPFDSPFIPLADEDERSSSMTLFGIPLIAAIVSTEAFFPTHSPASIDVEMDGVLYKNVAQKYFPPLNGKYYGATFSDSGFDWSEYPFAMFFDFEEQRIICATESPKEFRIKVGTADANVFVGGVGTQITANGTYKIKGYSYAHVNVT